jgi:hypothetical protein
MASMHIQHMQKALSPMNVQLHHVISDVSGKTGLQILRAIVRGDRDPQALAQYRDGRCRSSQEVIAASLEGNSREEHVFALQQWPSERHFGSWLRLAPGTQITGGKVLNSRIPKGAPPAPLPSSAKPP